MGSEAACLPFPRQESTDLEAEIFSLLWKSRDLETETLHLEVPWRPFYFSVRCAKGCLLRRRRHGKVRCRNQIAYM